jgi:EAL domain-containing protein (putative c-di-GMP-specific phosphodiesterase class I)
VIKIDGDIVHGIGHDDAKQALVEAFVSFGRRIGARLLAEGIERRADMFALTTLGVDLGQGFLLGKPAPEPGAPRRIEPLRRKPARRAPVAQDATRRRARVPSRA